MVIASTGPVLAAAQCDLTGSWTSSLGDLSLTATEATESGGLIVTLAETNEDRWIPVLDGFDATVQGSFAAAEGTGYIEGAIQGNRLSLRWMQPPTFADADLGYVDATIAADCLTITGTTRGDATADPAPWTAERRDVAVAAPEEREILEQHFMQEMATLEMAREIAPRRDFDVRAFAAEIDSNIDKIFDHVKAHVSPALYAGVLGGARGALMAHQASAADRAVLLAEVLAIHGFSTRYAFAELPDDLIERVIDTAISQAPTRPQVQPENFDAAVWLAAGVDAELVDEGRAIGDRLATTYRSLLDAALNDGGRIAGALEPVVSDAFAASDNTAAALRTTWAKRLREHVWVQVLSGGQWIDLDPTFRTSQVGEALLAAASVSETLPDAGFHRVTFSMTIERTSGDALETEGVGTWELKTADLAGLGLPTLSISLQPPSANDPWQLNLDDPIGSLEEGVSQDLANAMHYKPALVLSTGERASGTIFDLSGNTLPSDTQARLAEVFAAPLEDITNVIDDIFGGGGETPASATTALTAVWLDIKMTGPGQAEKNFNRVLMDRVGAAARKAGTAVLPDPATDAAARAALAGSYSFWVVPGVVHPDLAIDQIVALAIGASEVLKKGLLMDAGGPPVTSADLASVDRFANELADLRVLTQDFLADLEARSGLRSAQTSAHILGWHSLTRSDAAATAGASLFDIVHASLEVIGKGGGREASAEELLGFQLLYGAGMTLLEAQLAEARLAAAKCEGCALPVRNSAVSTLAAINESPDVLSLIASQSDVDRLVADIDDRALVSALLDGGLAVVAVKTDGDRALLWRFEPGNGDLLGILPTGEGAGLLEYLERVGASPTVANVSTLAGAILGWQGCAGQFSPFGLPKVKLISCIGCGLLGGFGTYLGFFAFRTAAQGVATFARLGAVVEGNSIRAHQAYRAYQQARRTGEGVAEALRASESAKVFWELSAGALKEAKAAAVREAGVALGGTVAGIALCSIGDNT